MTDRAILEGIRVASPCPASWAEMVGDDRTRSCAGCRKDVHDISGLTTEEAIGLVSAGGEAPCVRFYRREDGTVLTSDCPVGSRTIRRRMLRRVAGVGVVGVALAASGLVAMGLSRRQSAPPMPAWSGSTFDDWIDWGLASIGLRQRRVFTMGDVSFTNRPYRGALSKTAVLWDLGTDPVLPLDPPPAPAAP